jgi:hypothetical protein
MVGGVGATKSWSYAAVPGETEIPKHFTMVNWGVSGVVVEEYDRRGRLTKVWATTPEVSELQRSRNAEDE